MKTYEEMLKVLKRRMAQMHPCLHLGRNPVLLAISAKTIGTDGAVKALQQYSLLPSNIVEYLQLGEERLKEWPAAAVELKRNLQEELGSGTGGESHYKMLKKTTLAETGISLEDVTAIPETSEFLQKIWDGLWRSNAFYVAGMLYALEASAVSELYVVAELINRCAILAGKGPVILTGPLTDKEYAHQVRQRNSGPYSLLDFFALHIHEFETGHESGIADEFAPYLKDASRWPEFEGGFDYVLDEMEKWWAALAVASRFVDLASPDIAREPVRPKGPRKFDFASKPL